MLRETMGKDSGKSGSDRAVLVGVIKDRRDLHALRTQKWYRIPVAHAPRRKFKYLAFYQPAGFGREGKQILYYARILGQRIIRRKDLLPDEPHHPRAGNRYFLFRAGKVKKLSPPVRNITPRRISFAFTTLPRLLQSKNILELYNVTPTEEIVRKALKLAGIGASSQYHVSIGGERYCLDFAIFCRKGLIALECDNKKAHSGPHQRKKDEMKNNALSRGGWTVIRLPEQDIISDLRGCIARVKKAARKLGGLT